MCVPRLLVWCLSRLVSNRQMHNELYSDAAIRAPPLDMQPDGEECTNDPLLYTNYSMVRDEHFIPYREVT